MFIQKMENKNENKRSESARTNDSNQTCERNDECDNDKIHEHSWEIEEKSVKIRKRKVDKH